MIYIVRVWKRDALHCNTLLLKFKFEHWYAAHELFQRTSGEFSICDHLSFLHSYPLTHTFSHRTTHIWYIVSIFIYNNMQYCYIRALNVSIVMQYVIRIVETNFYILFIKHAICNSANNIILGASIYNFNFSLLLCWRK